MKVIVFLAVIASFASAHKIFLGLEVETSIKVPELNGAYLRQLKVKGDHNVICSAITGANGVDVTGDMAGAGEQELEVVTKAREITDKFNDVNSARDWRDFVDVLSQLRLLKAGDLLSVLNTGDCVAGTERTRANGEALDELSVRVTPAAGLGFGVQATYEVLLSLLVTKKNEACQGSRACKLVHDFLAECTSMPKVYYADLIYTALVGEKSIMEWGGASSPLFKNAFGKLYPRFSYKDFPNPPVALSEYNGGKSKADVACSDTQAATMVTRFAHHWNLEYPHGHDLHDHAPAAFSNRAGYHKVGDPKEIADSTDFVVLVEQRSGIPQGLFYVGLPLVVRRRDPVSGKWVSDDPDAGVTKVQMKQEDYTSLLAFIKSFNTPVHALEQDISKLEQDLNMIDDE
eukprot:c20289_g1_i1.p1 GENE.c20289_g1_i1~~c20289_g1_i1.p1  ORF type:complete len:402 (-),score=112.31 c20289_g1_i1:105-1310(-)